MIRRAEVSEGACRWNGVSPEVARARVSNLSVNDAVARSGMPVALT